jgi:hypothetical protein
MDTLETYHPTLSLSTKHKKVDSSMILSSPKRSDLEFAPIPPSPTHIFGALFVKKLCNLLSSLETAILRFWRGDCLPPDKDMNHRKKKEGGWLPSDQHLEGEVARCKDKKSGAIGKASTTSWWMIFGFSAYPGLGGSVAFDFAYYL